jgi:hypothetical protein
MAVGRFPQTARNKWQEFFYGGIPYPHGISFSFQCPGDQWIFGFLFLEFAPWNEITGEGIVR